MGTLPRLTIVLPTCSPRLGLLRTAPIPLLALVEKAVHALLTQPDPIGTEILVMETHPAGGVERHLGSVFGQEMYSGKLRVQRTHRALGYSEAIREGASVAQGAFLSIHDCLDLWLPGYLQALGPLLDHYDLIVSSHDHPGVSGDWLQAFLLENWALPSSTVVRRTLYEEVGGFPKPSIPFLVNLDYEFILLCLTTLAQKKSVNRTQSHPLDRFILMNSQYIQLGEGKNPLLEINPAWETQLKWTGKRIYSMGETLSLLLSAGNFPIRYWPLLARRLLKGHVR